MLRSSIAVVAALCGGLAAPALAQPAPDPGFTAGNVLVRLRAIGAIPEDSSSSVSVIGGQVSVNATPAPELDFSYFVTPHLSFELVAASTRHEIAAENTALGHVDVGSTYILPPTLTGQYHFLPQGEIDPYLGIGVTVAFWYDTNPAGGAVTKLGLKTTAGPAFDAGVDVHIAGPWYANFDIKQVILPVSARLDSGAIKAHVDLNPTLIGAGIGYRF